ncbi:MULTISPECIES: peptidoglycan recognition protein family protein [unclassified Solwaraspora]|uniref:peptidoglycan recognition protein family protein n=1 Tax=unclassified Solwaraspora TaxID=2627926 RepID=UPI00259BE756|nr:peptidoglycan recognition family protein [Solwaraspora sp. WMMA2056]WJK38299.1 peptidoglycan recognition family protein [Solwaraspora sp. WMMA2056]
MGIWTDLATWRGPTVNSGNGTGALDEPQDRLDEHHGIVVHIAAGYFEGTIAWQRNPASRVSSHFVVAKDGRVAQMVDTEIRAWTQRAGNRTWLSIENEGFLPDRLTPQQLEANAQLLARSHREHGIPVRNANSPRERGLGHHSMGAEHGFDWGHSQCPGPAIVAQKPAIVARAAQIITATRPPTPPRPRWIIDDLDDPGDNVMYLVQCTTQTPNPIFVVHDSGKVRHIGPAELAFLRSLTGDDAVPTITESEPSACARLLAEARVSQGFLQN